MGKAWTAWKRERDRREAAYKEALTKQRNLDAQDSPSPSEVRRVEKLVDKAYRCFMDHLHKQPPKDT